MRLEETPSLATVSQTVRQVRDELLQTVGKLIDLASVYDVDVHFHDTYVFFRSEIFENSLLLTFHQGSAPFPGTLYYAGSSPIRQAYFNHFSFHLSKAAATFSLQHLARSGNTKEQIVARLGQDRTTGLSGKQV